MNSWGPQPGSSSNTNPYQQNEGVIGGAQSGPSWGPQPGWGAQQSWGPQAPSGQSSWGSQNGQGWSAPTSITNNNNAINQSGLFNLDTDYFIYSGMGPNLVLTVPS